MKTYTLSRSEEIRAAIEAEFMVAELKDYASTLVQYFAEKIEAWMNAYRTPGNVGLMVDAMKKYGETHLGNPQAELENAMDDMKKVMWFRSSIDKSVTICVTEIEANPIFIEGNDDDEEECLHAQWMDAFLSRELNFKDKDGNTVSTRSFEDIISPYDIMGLRDHTVGISKFVDEEYHELFNRYL